MANTVEVKGSGLGSLSVTSPTGTGGENRRLTFEQAVPAAVWTIPHGWGVVPTSWHFVDSQGEEVYGAVTPSVSDLIVEFGAAFSGTAYIGG